MNEPIKEIETNLDKIQSTIFRNYLVGMKDNYGVIDFDKYNTFMTPGEDGEDRGQAQKVSYDNNVQAIKINRWIFDKKEQIIDKFKNIYSAFSQRKDSLALLIRRTMTGTEFYFVVKTDAESGGNQQNTKSDIELLKKSIKGNFPGTQIDSVDTSIENCFKMPKIGAISVLTNISAEKSEKHISQGIEKLINGVVPKKKEEEYMIIFLAEPITNEMLSAIKNGYEELASSIYPYVEYQNNEGTSESTARGESSSLSHSEGTNKSIAKTNGFNVGLNGGISTGKGWLNGFKDIFKKTTANFGASAGFQHSKTVSEGKNETNTDTVGTNYCLTEGTNHAETTNIKSYPLANLLKRIEKQIERLDNSAAIGMWKEATYILSSNTQTSENVANYLLGLLQGDDSFVETATINTWSGTCEHVSDNDEEDKNTDFRNIYEFVNHFTHPVMYNISDAYKLNQGTKENIEITDIELITPTTYVTSKELAQMMAFPYKSVQGLSSIECAEFERNILYKNVTKVWENNSNQESEQKSELPLGCIYHMQEKEANNEVKLDIDNLTKHTFVTGSTGSGKSTAIYKILHELKNKEKSFLVIEPAKGEYRKEFTNVPVYSTNAEIGQLLRINPFKFPSKGSNGNPGIHVSEHIDRLVEIFNVCWPMYAAMPAVLKDAVERAYVAAGWDLQLSTSKHENLYPCFTDVLKQLYVVINESDFDQEVKSNYIGSLVTRVSSLTKGIYRQIFTCDDIDDERLFKENAIVDISRVGSIETKAMIMGILVMKMQEYHTANSKATNSQLEHITVLEEAHNLLKRTSTEQSSETSNLLGKSVEMISNAIAEMRTYGEGFIIADQSPGLMDMSVIRNTNTKIILSLPDYSDRELVGKAVGLNEEQIIEVAKLPQGAAVVYQNEWVSPVLCAIEAYKDNENTSTVESRTDFSKLLERENRIRASLADIVLHNRVEELDAFQKEVYAFSMPAETKLMLLSGKDNFSQQERIEIIADLYYSDSIKAEFSKAEKVLSMYEYSDKKIEDEIYQRFVYALHIPDKTFKDADDIAAGIINILLLRIQTEAVMQVEQCEKLWGNVYNRR